MGVAWVSLIAAEMISGQFGIGYFTWEAYSLVQYSDIALGMICIGVLGLDRARRFAGSAMLVMPCGRASAEPTNPTKVRIDVAGFQPELRNPHGVRSRR